MSRVADHPADAADREFILEMLADLAGREKHLRIAGFAEWDRTFGLRAAVARRHGISPSIIDEIVTPSPARRDELETWEVYFQALRQARAAWRSPGFLAGITALLQDVGFPDAVARLVAPYMLVSYVHWADSWYEPGDRARDPFWSETTSQPRKRRGPRRNLRECAEWYYVIEIVAPWWFGRPARGRPRRGGASYAVWLTETRPGVWESDVREGGPFWGSVRSIAREVHRTSVHRDQPFSGDHDCGCVQKVRAGIRTVQRLLGLVPRHV